MPTGRTRTIALGLMTAILVGPGCAGQSPLLSRPTTVGTLKTNVAQLEHENEQARKQVAQLEADNRRMADQLEQERDANGELSARLDDARALLARKGIDPGTTEAPIVSRTMPANRSSRSGRKPPFAQIGGGLKPVPEEENGASFTEDNQDVEVGLPATRPSSATQSRHDTNFRWLPIATGAAESSPKR